ncbi:alpha,alpha-trehalose-phosphate synthase [UDP-forming] 1, partial [Tanacetum coccineum]
YNCPLSGTVGRGRTPEEDEELEKQLLDLAADLVGFHTYDYARHFMSACTHIIGLEGTP